MKCDMDEILTTIRTEARKLGACDILDNVTSLEAGVAIFLSPKGMEFCKKQSFPTLLCCRDLNRLPKNKLKKMGIYIDAGLIQLKNPHGYKETKAIALIGNTHARITYKGNHQRFVLFLMHGASAEIIVKEYAVLRIEKTDDTSIKITKDLHSITL